MPILLKEGFTDKVRITLYTESLIAETVGNAFRSQAIQYLHCDAQCTGANILNDNLKPITFEMANS